MRIFWHSLNPDSDQNGTHRSASYEMAGTDRRSLSHRVYWDGIEMLVNSTKETIDERRRARRFQVRSGT
jgi:hypothetical protein